MNAIETSQKTAQKVTSKSSFYWAMRVLPETQREAMYQIYVFCRAVDDIADSGLPRAQAILQLNQWREKIDACYQAQAPEALTLLAQEITRFALDRADFNDMIDGMQMDVQADICAPDEVTLDLYCDRVASSAGRLSVKVFGLPQEEGRLLAHDLGRALQLTNILRDLDVDAEIQRCYLPKELLYKAKIFSQNPQEIVRSANIDLVCETLAQRALVHFDRAKQLMQRLPSKQVRAPRLMYMVYFAILQNAIKRGFAYPRQPLQKPRACLLWALIRSIFD